MPPILFSLLEEVALTIIADLFVSYSGRLLQNPLNSMRLDIAKKRVMLGLMESLDPMFRVETSPEHAQLLAINLQAITKQTKFTPELIALHRHNIDKLVDYSLSKAPPDQEIIVLHLENLLRAIIKQLYIAVIAMANVLPEWERISWDTNFNLFDEVLDKLAQQSSLLHKIIDEPSRAIESFESSYRRYVIRDLERIYLRGIGNLGDVTSLALETAYVQPRLRQSIEQAQEDSIETITRRKHREEIDILTALQLSKFLIILGRPGSGKSTLARFVALSAAHDNLAKLNPLLKPALVPFLLRVSDFDNFDDLPTPRHFVSICAPMLEGPEAERFVLEILDESRGLIIIDGLDECQIVHLENKHNSLQNDTPTQRNKVLRWLEALAMTFPGNYILVTSRPAGYQVGRLKAVGATEYEVLPLSREQQKDYVNQWYQALETALMPEDKPVALLKAGSLAQNLLNRLEAAKTVQFLADTPLMLSVICVLHKHKGESLPERKVELLSDCLNILLYDWRKAHGLKHNIIGDLIAKDLRSLLEPLAWQMALRNEEQITYEELITVFRQYLPEINQPADRATEIISTIRDRTGVLLQFSPQTYGFEHLLFQEYLAAEECARIKDSYDILLSKVDDPRWREIIPMAVAASRGNQEILIRALLHHGSVSLAWRSLISLERVTVKLRQEVSVHVLERIRSHFDHSLISSLIETGSRDSAEILVEIVLDLPVISAVDLYNYAITWEFNEDAPKASLSVMAAHTITRCLLCRDTDLGETWGKGIHSIGYYNKDITPNRGISWDCLMLGFLDSVVQEQGAEIGDKLLDDPLYNYAVMLDLVDARPGYLDHVMWRAFEYTTQSKALPPEKSLMALHFAWYACDPNEHVVELMTYLQKFPRNVSPAFQIGLVNNAMSRVSSSVRDDMKAQVQALWQECAIEIMVQICGLIDPWQDGLLVGTGDDLRSASVEELTSVFKQTFEDLLNSSEPFNFS